MFWIWGGSEYNIRDGGGAVELKDRVYRELEKGGATLVFTTENTARWWLAQYAAETGRSIPAKQAMAFDDFKALFAPRHEEKPADKYHRLAFTTNYIASGKTHLKYLYKDEYIGTSRKFVSFIAGILPDLGEIEEAKIRNRELYNDLRQLAAEYSLFLKTNRLFEPGWEKHSIEYFPAFYEHSYVLAGYDANINMQELMRELGEQKNVSYLSVSNSVACPYGQFETEEAELEALFANLAALKRSGTPMEDIVLTTPELKRLYPRLERKSLEYGVPLSFVTGLTISKTVPGQYLKGIEKCLDEDLSFHSLENLLLNSALPYKRMEDGRALIRFIIEHNIAGGSLTKKGDKLLRELRFVLGEDSPVTELYLGLTSRLAEIERAKSGEELTAALHALTSYLFSEAEFTAGCREDKDVYSFVIKEITRFGRIIAESGLTVNNLFRLFVSDLDKLSYVSQEKKAGIKVYAYGQDYLLTPKYRFIFALNDRNSQSERKALSFLEDHEVDSRTSYNTTDSLISHYLATSENVTVTGAETTYAGAESPPCCFTNVVRAGIGTLPVTECAPVEYSPVAVSGYPLPGLTERKLSYSAIDSYVKCPYKAFLNLSSLVDSKAEDMRFEPAEQDDKAIGSLLHEVIEKFMEAHMGETLCEEKLADYHAEMIKILDAELADNHKFDDFTKICIRGCYSDSLTGLLDGMLIKPQRAKAGYTGSFTPIGNEIKLENNRLTGFTDSAVTDADGKVILLDYKKGTGNATYQLILYKRLYEELNKESEVKNCFFYYMGKKDGNPFAGFTEESEKKLGEALDNDIAAVEEGYREGKWPTAAEASNCARCRMKSVCRARFNLR